MKPKGQEVYVVEEVSVPVPETSVDGVKTEPGATRTEYRKKVPAGQTDR